MKNLFVFIFYWLIFFCTWKWPLEMKSLCLHGHESNSNSQLVIGVPTRKNQEDLGSFEKWQKLWIQVCLYLPASCSLALRLGQEMAPMAPRPAVPESSPGNWAQPSSTAGPARELSGVNPVQVGLSVVTEEKRNGICFPMVSPKQCLGKWNIDHSHLEK